MLLGERMLMILHGGKLGRKEELNEVLECPLQASLNNFLELVI
jgi:hypothetical protein